jgi:hypothetical protein
LSSPQSRSHVLGKRSKLERLHNTPTLVSEYHQAPKQEETDGGEARTDQKEANKTRKQVDEITFLPLKDLSALQEPLYFFRQFYKRPIIIDNQSIYIRIN